jgi:type IV pilus assembly protein PilO
MPKNSKLAPKIVLKSMSLRDPRIVMRAIMGVLLAANLVAAVIAFKPFGGSADDLRKQQASLSSQLRQLKTNLEKSKQHVAKIEIARTEGDEFVNKYIMEKRAAPHIMFDELTKVATDANVHVLPDNYSYEEIEGSDALQMVAVNAPFEGDYAGLVKVVNELEKSPRFWIIDEMSLTAPQQNNQKTAAAAQPSLNVNLHLLAFVRDEGGASQ